MLKAEIVGEGIPTKGTPQGGILSPLLSNVVLNELDWWLSSQWLDHPTRHKYSHNSNKFKALKQTQLKQFYGVRYADDFKIFCSDYTTAVKVFHATKLWLKDRLDLDISEEKSKITKLKKRATNFLGFRLRARPSKKMPAKSGSVIHE